MKSNFRLASLLMVAMFSLSYSTLKCQDPEKQKVIDVINKELDAAKKKDKAKWADCWVHDARVLMLGADAFGYGHLASWDTLESSRKEFFSTPVSPDSPLLTMEKKDFQVSVKGNVAVVDLTQVETKSKDSGTQTVVLEKVNGNWKILKMIGVNQTSYNATDENVEAGINRQGYLLLSLNKTDEAIKVFTLNTELYPKAFNTWDSLGEAYMIKGDKTKAIEYYQKSVDLNPKNENGKKYLKELTASK